jgi:DNA-binding NtrC family response regulator
MASTDRHLLVCVDDEKARATIDSAAGELSVRLLSAPRPDCLELAAADCALIEFREFGAHSFQTLENCRRIAPEVPIIVVLNGTSTADTIRASQASCFEYLDNLSSKQEFLSAIQPALAQTNRRRSMRVLASEEPWRQQLVGQSTSMEHVARIVRLVAARKCTVLITGETGTGKEMAARAIHLASIRARRPMISVNCSAIPENLIEAELFGHVKGAYTGAVGSRIGRFEQASGSTLFLDEIADLPFELQSKLMRVLQEK